MHTQEREGGRGAHGDFGRLIERRPREVVEARSERDVVDAVRRARRLGVELSARGQGHTTRGQSLIEGGILVATSGLDGVVIDGDTAVVGAGARWDAVVRAAWAHGRTPPVLTDYLGLSVGGTLSVGGVGGASFRYGMQTDQALELRVVTGNGELRTCARDRDPALFDACRAGLGQVAIVVEARLRLVPAPERVRVYRMAYDDLAGFLEDQIRIVDEERFDEVRGSVAPGGGPGRFVIEAVRYLAAGDGDDPLRGLRCRRSEVEIAERGYLEYADRLRAMERDMRLEGAWEAHHPWFDMFVPGSRAHELIEHALGELDAIGMESGHVMMYPLTRRSCRTPLLPVPADPHALLFDVLPDVARGRQDRLDAFEGYARRVFDRARRAGARMYPIGYPVGTPDADWREHFGAAFAGLAAARAAHDPGGRLGAGVGVFAGDARARTLGEIAAERIVALGRATGQTSDAAQLTEIAEVMSGGWWTERAGVRPAWASDLTDDGTPFELSLALEGGVPQLRLLVEPRPVEGDPIASFDAALDVGRALGERFGADLRLFESVADLFAPAAEARPRFVLWYAVQMSASGPLFKVYANPELRGEALAREVTREAFERVGLASAWESLTASLGPSTRIPYFSVDLCPRDHARAKVYLAHVGATADAIARAAAGSSNLTPGDVVRFLDALVGDGGSAERPTLTCHAFRGPSEPADVTLHVPLRCHVTDDRHALTRARAMCAPGDGEVLEAAVRAAATRPLDAGRGLLTYLSLRRAAGRLRVTAYLAPELYAVTPPRAAGWARLGDVRRAIAAEQARYAAHRFFRRLEAGGTRSEVRAVAERLAFFIMCFQDMLRVAHERCTDPELVAALSAHAREDFGHERWFLADCARLGVDTDLGAAFEPDRARIRDVSYAILAQLMLAEHDATRLAVLLALEGAAHEFFDRFNRVALRAMPEEELLYFGRTHEVAESEHEIDACTGLFERPVPDPVMREMLSAVSGTFAEMSRVAQVMEDALTGASRPRPRPGERSGGAAERSAREVGLAQAAQPAMPRHPVG